MRESFQAMVVNCGQQVRRQHFTGRALRPGFFHGVCGVFPEGDLRGETVSESDDRADDNKSWGLGPKSTGVQRGGLDRGAKDSLTGSSS